MRARELVGEQSLSALKLIERRNAMETDVAVKLEAHEHEVKSLKHGLYFSM